MRAPISTRLVCCAIFCCVFRLSPSLATDERPNVLLIAIDDMNDWVSCLDGHPDARSPHIDRLAERGVLFTNAHCQAPICNPSRTSIMYGVRPSTSGVYSNSARPWTASKLKNRVTMPRHFANHGYTTYCTGKIYHGSRLPPDDFEHVGPRPGQRSKQDARLVPEEKGKVGGLWDFGAQAYEEDHFVDHLTTTWAIESLATHAKKHPKAPFFMAVGYYRPHVPLYSPRRVFDQIPYEDIDLPVVKENDRLDLPPIVDEVTVPPVAPKHSWFVESGRWREAVQSYLACIRWTDEQVGRLIDGLDKTPHAENCVVVLYSDHGFFLGEKQRWAKQSLWERATRVPFIVSAPDMSRGKRCGQPTELLSIYPTLVDLCGVGQGTGLDGVSLRPLLKNPKAVWPHAALTTHGRNNHSVRTTTHRYIRYRDGSEELYDHRNDPNEWTNIAGERTMATLKRDLAKRFPTENAPAVGK